MTVHSSTKIGSQFNWYPNELINAEHWGQCGFKDNKYLWLPKCIHSNLNDKDKGKDKEKDKHKDCGFKDGKISPASEGHCTHSNLNDKDKDNDKDKECVFKDGKITPASEVHPLQFPLQVLILPFIWANFNQGFWGLPGASDEKARKWARQAFQPFNFVKEILCRVKMFQGFPGSIKNMFLTFSHNALWECLSILEQKNQLKTENFSKFFSLHKFLPSCCLKLCKESETVSLIS